MRTGGKKIAAALIAAILGFGTGCGSDGTTSIEALQDCGFAGLLALLSSVERLGDVIQEIEGIDRPGVTITPTANENEFDFVVTLDLNGDRSTETTISGLLTFANDPTDGVENGDTAVLALNQPSGTEVSAVSAMVDLTFLPTGVSLVGAGSVNGILGCNVDFSFPASDPLLVGFNEPSVEVQRRLALEFAGFLTVSGTAEMTISNGSNLLTSTVLFSPSSQDITFTNNMLNSSELNDSNVMAPLGDVEFQRVQRCLLEQVFSTTAIGFAIETVQNAVADGLTGMTAEGDPFTFTQVTGNTYDITLITTDGGIQATVTARATFDSDPTVQGFTGRADVASWTFRVRIQAPAQIAGIDPGEIFTGDMDGTSTGPMRATFTDSCMDSISGRGRFVRLDGTCTANVDVPVTNPLILDDTVVDPPPGRFEVDMVVEGIPFVATFVFDGETFFGNELVTDASYDGIPVPGNLLQSLFGFVD